jgi:hypothetical protein
LERLEGIESLTLQLATRLLRLGHTLQERQIDAIHEKARRSTTWRL